MDNNYSNNYKPERHRSGNINNSNLDSESNSFRNLMLGVTPLESLNGFSGAAEFDSLPLRQLFFNRHKQFSSEWDTGFFSEDFINKYVTKHIKNVIATHYNKNKGIKRCLLYLGGKECTYVYIYYIGDYSKKEADKFGICLLFTEKTNRINKLMDYFIKFAIQPKDEVKGNLNLLIKAPHGFGLQPKEIICPEIDFNINYNADFKSIHNLIIEKLSIDNSKGLVLLHGLAGTGKTTYIRYLIHTLKKKVIYIPPSLINYISDPELINFFVRNSNSILIVEDAENVLLKRNGNSTQSIANILNLTDGLLSDCANIQIVATFNTNITNIDEALLRKGRLIAKYEFKKLEESRSKKLGKKLGVNINTEQTLSDIYNYNDESFIQNKSKIGYK